MGGFVAPRPHYLTDSGLVNIRISTDPHSSLSQQISGPKDHADIEDEIKASRGQFLGGFVASQNRLDNPHQHRNARDDDKHNQERFHQVPPVFIIPKLKGCRRFSLRSIRVEKSLLPQRITIRINGLEVSLFNGFQERCQSFLSILEPRIILIAEVKELAAA